jgi:hypothetical protein
LLFSNTVLAAALVGWLWNNLKMNSTLSDKVTPYFLDLIAHREISNGIVSF